MLAKKNGSPWLWPIYCYLMILVLTACSASTLTPVPSHVPGHPTATTEADAWRSLQQRPLHLPTLVPGMPCPTTQGHQVHPAFGALLGSGPVYVGFFDGSDNVHGVFHFADAQTFAGGTSDWGGDKVLWVIKPPYRGPVLIRGGRLDGSSPMRFNGGLDQQGPWDYSDQASSPSYVCPPRSAVLPGRTRGLTRACKLLAAMPTR